MSEPIAERLSRFTPDGSGLDRDGLLFEAGRASVPPPRRWQALAAILLVGQLVTLWLLWVGQTPTFNSPGGPPPPGQVAPPGSGEQPDSSGWWAMRRLIGEGKSDPLPPAVPSEKLEADPPPLHVMVSTSSPLLD